MSGKRKPVGTRKPRRRYRNKIDGLPPEVKGAIIMAVVRLFEPMLVKMAEEMDSKGEGGHFEGRN